jgi:hypothetical protein
VELVAQGIPSVPAFVVCGGGAFVAENGGFAQYAGLGNSTYCVWTMARRNEENQTRKIVGYFVEKLAGEMEGSAARGCACYGFLVDNSSSRCVCAGKRKSSPSCQ